jgi:predicted NAD/FAD-binding protein
LRSTAPFALGSDSKLESSLDDELEAPLEEIVDDEVDVVIVGAGLGGLCAGAILNTLYGKKVAVFESHYLPGGCAHAFDRKASNGMTFTFDSGPTILLG